MIAALSVTVGVIGGVMSYRLLGWYGVALFLVGLWAQPLWRAWRGEWLER